MSPGSRPSHGAFPERFPARSRITPRSITTSPNPTRIFPSSDIGELPAGSLLLERQLRLASGGRRRSVAQVGVSGRRGLPPVGGADHEADLEQERLHDFGQGFGFVVDGGGNGLEPGGTAVELLDDRREEAAIE